MAKSVAIIDYGTGNIVSLKSAFEYIGVMVEIANCSDDIKAASTLVLPGVGTFDNASRQLSCLGMLSAIRESVQVQKKKILGICLGMQMFFEGSDEGDNSQYGLGIYPYRVQRIKQTNRIVIPHIGFNKVSVADEHNNAIIPSQSLLLKGIDTPYFYFVHSYRVAILDTMNGTKLQTTYGERFLSGYEEDNIFLTQFHPEKSQTNGLQLLKNFIEI